MDSRISVGHWQAIDIVVLQRTLGTIVTILKKYISDTVLPLINIHLYWMHAHDNTAQLVLLWITHFCVKWSITVPTLLAYAFSMAMYNSFPNIQYVIVITWTQGGWPIYLQYMCMYRACSPSWALMASLEIVLCRPNCAHAWCVMRVCAC